MAAEEKRVYMLTSKGNAELTAGKTSLTPDELKLLVMVDGMATVKQVADRTPGSGGLETVIRNLQELARKGYISDPDGTAAINISDFFQEADFGMASLQANGFYVRIARRREPPPRKPDGGKYTVVAVEDDAQLAKLMRTYLQMEGFVVRTAATREEINKALREPPKPDMIILDVVLPDSDGFELLQRMRAHEFVKDMPIIMATGKATREAVLQGLQRGADGYVTKPYDVPVLLAAMKTVLGLA